MRSKHFLCVISFDSINRNLFVFCIVSVRTTHKHINRFTRIRKRLFLLLADEVERFDFVAIEQKKNTEKKNCLCDCICVGNGLQYAHYSLLMKCSGKRAETKANIVENSFSIWN